MSTYVLVALGGLLGANARYLVSTWSAARWGTSFPFGTLLINVTGSFVMGFFLRVLAGRFDDNADARLLVATGFLGAYTTFSTFAFESVALLRQRNLDAALRNLLGSAVLGIAGAAGGIALAATVVG